jgi:hypothetical protein
MLTQKLLTSARYLNIQKMHRIHAFRVDKYIEAPSHVPLTRYNILQLSIYSPSWG